MKGHPLRRTAKLTMPIIPRMHRNIQRPFALRLTITSRTVRILLTLRRVRQFISTVRTGINTTVELRTRTTVVTAQHFRTRRHLFINNRATIHRRRGAFAKSQHMTTQLSNIFNVRHQGQRHWGRRRERWARRTNASR